MYKYLEVYVETLSVFFMKIPIIFNDVVTMINKFYSREMLLETKNFLSTVVYASNNTSVFNRLQQSLLMSRGKTTAYLKLSSNVKRMKQTNGIH